jgi:acetyltransferase-like isoleucine patch superfamily enzyme
MANEFKVKNGLYVSGSTTITNNTTIAGSLTVNGGITGSLHGTASWAENALTASFALSGAGSTVTHTQLTASTTWSFNHNLNTQTPLLQVYDLGYEQILPNEIISIDAFTSEIRFDYTQAGYAVASNGSSNLTITGSTSRLTQTVAATTWSFAHNLGTKYPGFEVFDSNDDVIIPAGIHAVDADNAEIYFALPSTGVAIANFSGINGLTDNAISASYAATASYSDQFNIGQTQTRYATVASSINGSNTVFTQATGSYTSAFFKYTVTSGSNARSGEIVSVWNGTTAEFTDNSTTDIGTTTVVTSSVAISGANVQLNMQTNTSGWRIKSVATFM